MTLMTASAYDFSQIYADFHPKIVRYLGQLVGETEAEDLAQEVFIRVHRALPGFRGDSQLSTWIYRIATNTAIDRLRSPSSRRMVEMDAGQEAEEAGDEQADRDAWTGEEAPPAEELLFRKQRLDCYCDYIDNLPSNYRGVVALSELGEYAASEIAEMLGLSLDTVKIRLHRGRARLLSELRKACKPEDWL